MYIVSLTYTNPIEDVEALLEGHIAWLDRYFASGDFLFAGRKDPRTGGVIVAREMDRETLNQIVMEDPFVAVANYEITKVNVTRANEALNSLVGI
ncbi:YciI family protein [Erwinia sp. V71]|uniref:YciI family protein n=1 Tax=Erwinia sp. V71 TaxID=3369424 RepID=UPI003F642C2E